MDAIGGNKIARTEKEGGHQKKQNSPKPDMKNSQPPLVSEPNK
jgi:hypothetical protein